MNGRNNIKGQYSNFTQESSSREKAAKEKRARYYLQNCKKKIAQVKQRRQEKRELPMRTHAQSGERSDQGKKVVYPRFCSSLESFNQRTDKRESPKIS